MKAMINEIRKDFNFKDKRIKYTFFSAMTAGLLAHGYMFLNKLSWHDDIYIVVNAQGEELGRWLLAMLTKLYLKVFGGNASMPWFIGACSLLFLAFGAILVVQILEIDHKTDCMIIGSMMAVFPSVTTLFGYMWVAGADTFSILLSIMVVYGLIKLKRPLWRIIFGSNLLCMSMGIYQAFIGVTAILLMILFLKNMIREPCRNVKDVLAEAGIDAAVLVLGLFEYMVINKVFVKIKGVAMTAYQGLDQMGEISAGKLWQGITVAYHDFLSPVQHKAGTMFMGNMRLVYYFLIGIVIILVLVNFLRILKKSKVNAAIFILGAACIPVAYNFIYLMGASNVHGIMVYGKCMIFVLCVVLTRSTDMTRLFWKKAVVGAGVALSLFSVLFYIELANKCYLKAQLQQTETIAWITTLITRIKSTAGYDDEMKIAYINQRNKQDLTAYMSSPINESDLMPYDAQDLVNDSVWQHYMIYWCGFYQPEVEDYTVYEDNTIVEHMPSYPDDGSIQVIDDVVVVKF